MVVLLWLNVVAEALTIHSNFSLHAFLGSPTSAAEAERLDAHAMLVDAVAFWLLVATAVVFLVWLHRATSNARRLAGDSFAFSPGWAVGYWFIPIINLYRPYQVVRDVYRTSRDHANPQAGDGAPIVGWWWGLWIASSFVITRSMMQRLDPSASAEQFQQALAQESIGNGLSIAAAILLTVIVNRIGRRQGAVAGTPVA